MTSNKTKYEPFRFKQFLVHHDLCSMKVGVDGVLLGAWLETNNCSNILDVGTGSGLIALMLAQKNANADIHAIEIDKSALQQAEINFNLSPWTNRLKLHEGDFLNFQHSINFDLIVSNPPYFSNSSLSLNDSRNTARHTISLTIEKLVTQSKKLLSPEGKLCFIYPFENLREVESVLKDMHLSIKKLTFVKPTASKTPKRILLEIVQKTSVDRIENELIIESDQNEFSKEYKALTKDFYLKF